MRVEKREKSNFQIIERNGFSRVVYWRASPVTITVRHWKFYLSIRETPRRECV